ncbi:uncharacterized protein [Gossypium hirsutum]|uniref:Uncharacterized protein isoform X2 n=1 Tax=Gossypium hirsutum TaxID=3635 RepID=A0A1U8K8J7_GOSHI|nr:uncharacterized protein LOC107914410 isoform X2 [Gossypium hirsutum]
MVVRCKIQEEMIILTSRNEQASNLELLSLSVIDCLQGKQKSRMGKGNKEGTSKQFRWTKPMEHVFLEILAEEAQKGNKPSKTFKADSINRVVEAISERFQVQCDAKHVENHLRSVKISGRLYAKFEVKVVLDGMIT